MDDNKALNKADIIAALRCKPQDGTECNGCPYAGTVDGCDTGAIMSDAATMLERDAEPNDPLTLEELREMDGEPVYLVAKHMEPHWDIVRVDYDHDYPIVYFRDTTNGRLQANGYGKTWLAYRRKPSGGGE